MADSSGEQSSRRRLPPLGRTGGGMAGTDDRAMLWEVIHDAHDLGATIRGLRPDAQACGVTITDDWCRDQMHDLGMTRYEDVTADTIAEIADRVDRLAR